MLPLWSSTCIFIFFLLLSSNHVGAHSIPTLAKLAKGHGSRAGPSADLRLVPSEAVVYPGETVTFECRTPASGNASLSWEVGGQPRGDLEVSRGETLAASGEVSARFSRITLRDTNSRMGGEVACIADGGRERVVAFLVVAGVRNGGDCQASTDCTTDKAVCEGGVCVCPKNFARLRIKGRGIDVCREMIYSLYDLCEYDEECANLVDPKSVCKSVCVCAPWARDRRGKCVAISEISYNRSQEMYRVGLIAVTCIIILIVAVSLWVTLKRSCHEHSINIQRSMSQSDQNPANRMSFDITSDKPPSYEDVFVTNEAGDTVANVGSPPNFKDALKHCMTAKKLLRQVSAPAGQILPQTDTQGPKT